MSSITSCFRNPSLRSRHSRQASLRCIFLASICSDVPRPFSLTIRIHAVAHERKDIRYGQHVRRDRINRLGTSLICGIVCHKYTIVLANYSDRHSNSTHGNTFTFPSYRQRMSSGIAPQFGLGYRLSGRNVSLRMLPYPCPLHESGWGWCCRSCLY
jgi:hypothetical protein